MASIDTKTKLERFDVVSIFCDSKKPSASSTGSHERGEEESGVKIKSDNAGVRNTQEN